MGYMFFFLKLGLVQYHHNQYTHFHEVRTTAVSYIVNDDFRNMGMAPVLIRQRSRGLAGRRTRDAYHATSGSRDPTPRDQRND